MKPTKSLEELSKLHGVSVEELQKQLDKGVKEEKEHTNDESVARKIALHHLEEDPKYYDKLAKAMESYLPTFKEFLREEEEKFTPPKGAQNAAKKVLRWKEEHGDEVDAMTPVGWARARQLASGKSISKDIVKRMAQFARHKENAKIDPKYKDTPWKDRGKVSWLAWGNDVGIEWAKKLSSTFND